MSVAVGRAPRGRPRCPESQARILAATAELLETESWAAITVEAIAARAKVGKQTIYKWWGGRTGLVMDAYLSSIEAQVRQPNTGDVERDLVLFLQRSSKVLRETTAGRTLAVIIAESQNDDRLAREFRERFLAVRRDGLREMLQRGIDRGQLRPELDLELVMDLIYGAFWYRILVRTAPLSARYVKDATALIWTAIRVAPKDVRH